MFDNLLIKYNPCVANITPYKGGKSASGLNHKTVKLSSNESRYGPTPKVQSVFENAFATSSLYPKNGSPQLGHAIGEVLSLDPDRVLCGHGSDEILQMIAEGFICPGDEVIYCQHAFLLYKHYTLLRGATPVVVQEKNLTTDIDAILKAVTPRTKAVFIANPNNPTGTYIPQSDLQRLRSQLPRSVLLVIDEAYVEYMMPDEYTSCFGMVDHPDGNVIVTRTFSKIYGIASLRIGWAYCPSAVLEVLNHVRSPFNTSSLGIACGAAAIRDQAYVNKVRDANRKCRKLCEDAFEELGILVTRSHGNFTLINLKTTENANTVLQLMEQEGYILRDLVAYGLPQYLRITIGLEADCRGVVDTLRRVAPQLL